MASTELSAAQQLQYSTIRLECDLADGSLSVGTGFVFCLRISPSEISSLLVTNKHVIEGATRIHLITHAHVLDDGSKEPTGLNYSITYQDNLFVPHPDADVDLCAMPLSFLFEAAKREARFPHLIHISDDRVPSQDVLASLDAIEDVVMVGYPNGLWDDVNNFPIFRRGMTATHVARDFQGRKEFVVDMACFPGSSGSPVFLLNRGAYRSRTDWNIDGGPILFLGVLWGGPQIDLKGEVVVRPVPHARIEAVTSTSLNLGFVIRAERVLELAKLIAYTVEPNSILKLTDD